MKNTHEFQEQEKKNDDWDIFVLIKNVIVYKLITMYL